MDLTGVMMVLTVPALVAAGMAAAKAWQRSEEKRVAEAKSWPTTDVTVQSAAMENVNPVWAARPLILPVLAFSYDVGGEYYSGHFAVSSLDADPNGPNMSGMMGQKLIVHYNPAVPGKWFIPEKTICGRRIYQDIR